MATKPCQLGAGIKKRISSRTKNLILQSTGILSIPTPMPTRLLPGCCDHPAVTLPWPSVTITDCFSHICALFQLSVSRRAVTEECVWSLMSACVKAASQARSVKRASAATSRPRRTRAKMASWTASLAWPPICWTGWHQERGLPPAGEHGRVVEALTNPLAKQPSSTQITPPQR